MILDKLRNLIREIRDAADKLQVYGMKGYAQTLSGWANTLESVCIALAHRDTIKADSERVL